MKKLMLIAIVGVIGLAASVGSAAAILTVELECRDLVAGEFQVDVFVTSSGDSPVYGLADMEFDVTTSDSTGLADSKEGVDGFGLPTGKVVTTWATPSSFLNIAPAWEDENPPADGDMDAMRAATGATDTSVVNFGVTRALVCTQTWIYNGPGVVCLEVDVNPESRVFDPAVTGLKRHYDVINTSGDSIPEPATMVLLGLGGVLTLIRRKR